MKIKSQLMLAMCSLLIGCSSNQTKEPTEVVFTFGETSITAPINENSAFASTKETDKEKVQLSGNIQKQDADYIVEVEFISEEKAPKERHSFNSTVLVKADEPLVVGHLDDDEFIINLKR
ncbi:hypothetical protein EUZ85_16275 [Hahella sp. KA22]|uniref:hypothetical protein n=1 Tax=Hahella sp. KA22 TaxID=1628392 RepID=UPI000FDE2BB4|nr:hypothetical protein [Hahella sp. KA22]AZZ92194.1 hypothetical protein ENC22_13710 [Hahella sp. KA22]QAY55565.1 hypothetical protein EUZ85_16275 [Hahella sp. KA22]